MEGWTNQSKVVPADKLREYFGYVIFYIEGRLRCCMGSREMEIYNTLNHTRGRRRRGWLLSIGRVSWVEEIPAYSVVSIAGLAGGVALSVFSKTLTFLIGAAVFGIQVSSCLLQSEEVIVGA